MPKAWDTNMREPKWPTQEIGNWGIIPENLFTPIEMERWDCGIIMHPTTKNLLHNCKRILLWYEFNWYPSKNLFQIYSMKEEYRTSSIFHRYISIIESRIPSALPTIQCRYDLRINEFNREISNVSIVIAHDLMVDRLIINVRVRITRIGCHLYR